ncbi:MAG: hypothetical protein WAM92_08690 [Mycobacterium sp.]
MVWTKVKRHFRFHLHINPTWSSWRNLAERIFRELADKNLRRGSFPSIADPIASTELDPTVTNAMAKPLIWTATAESIGEEVRRRHFAFNRSANTHHQQARK